MYSPNEKFGYGFFIFFCCVNAVMFMCFCYYALGNISSLTNYDKENCIISDIVPNTNETFSLDILLNDGSNWVKCDCGKKCSFTTFCTKIFVYPVGDISSNSIIQKDTFRDKNEGSECTFKNGNCDNTPQYQYSSYLQAQRDVSSYSLGQEIDCWVDKNDKYNIYLNNTFDLTIVIAISATFFVTIIINILIYIFYIKEKKVVIDEEKNTVSKDNGIENHKV